MSIFCDHCPLLHYTLAGKKWTAQEVLNIYRNPTTYEKDHGILAGSWILLRDCGDIKFHVSYKSDHTMTLLIIHRQGLTDNWVGWLVNEGQAQAMLKAFPETYAFVDHYNAKTRQLASRT